MTTFEEREKAFEAKYRHDQETRFRVNVRRNKLLGHWAAEQMGLAGDEKDAYAKQVVTSDFAKPGDEDVLEKILEDFADKGVDISAHRVRKEMDRLLEVAKEQIREEAVPHKPESI